MSGFTGLTDDEKDRLRDWWDEETTVGVESVFPEVARIVIARMAEAWLEGNTTIPGYYNPYRATEEKS